MTDGAGPRRAAALALVLALLSGCGAEGDAGGAAPALTAADIELNNRGVALMGYFDYPGAREAFAEVVARRPAWLDARVNLAVATLNRQGEGDETRALELVTGVLEEDPQHLRAHYVSGLLRLYLGELQAARAHFEHVAGADPQDAYAAYYLGQIESRLGDAGQALALFRRAMELDPYLRSAYYGAGQVLRRLGRTEEAAALLGEYERFEANPRARLAEFKYTRMGPRGETLAVDLPGAVAAPPPAGPVLEAGRRVATLAAAPAEPTLTTVDLDRDGRQDLFVAGGGESVVLLGTAGGGFAVAAHPLAGIRGVRAALWGDIDNDGLVDAYLCRDGANQLWRQTGPGRWQDVAAATGTANGERACADAALFDADHDGDLDVLVVNDDGPNELLNNDRDGSFRPLAASQGLAGGGASRAVLTTDLDGDRDVDIVIVNAVPPHEVYLNDRLWEYRPAPGFERFRNADIAAAVAGDVDTDGHVELYTRSADGALTRWQNEAGAWLPTDVAAADDTLATATLELVDLDGDGVLELLRSGPAGVAAHRIGDRAGSLLSMTEPAVAALTLVIDPARGPALVRLDESGALYVHAGGGGRHAFAVLTMSGKQAQAESMRSNRSGIGTRVALRSGSRWTIADTFDSSSAPGQSLKPLALGLGDASRADYVALNWSDGVFQTELDLAAGELHRIEETQRQLSSCPVLFAWDGERFRFVSDVLGVGGLGFFVAPGAVASARPWEYFLLPAGLPAARDGRLELKLTEPMEEIAYLDAARLHVYDLPPGTAMVLDERMVVSGPPATGEALFYRRSLAPLSAVNDRGADVTSDLAAVDGRAAPPGSLDARFVGRLAAPHVLTLSFDGPLDTGTGTPVLVADGWVEYPYSQTVFAAWQAGADYAAPTLEAAGADGVWRTVHARFGYPAGMPRQMALPLPALPAGTTRLRLSTTLEIYWDRIAVVWAEPSPHRHRVLELRAASQRHGGFPLRTDGPQRRPHYDYGQRSTFWDTRYPRGLYSELGEVTELVAAVDDAVAVIGPGEEVDLRFDAPAAPPAADWSRRYVLEVRGWAKDMDLYTRNGETVGPLPMRDGAAPGAGRRDELHRRYHRRFQHGY